jgi:hypothetical protein
MELEMSQRASSGAMFCLGIRGSRVGKFYKLAPSVG